MFATVTVRPNQIDEANGPTGEYVQPVCHDTLPWLIFFSLGLMRVSEKLNQT